MGGQLPCVLASCLSLVVTGQPSAISAPNFHFYCHTGYSQADCNGHVRRLRDVLAGMDLAPLGDWAWVLVRSQDWKPILRRVGRDPGSPAFTILEKHQIFLEEALFRADPERSRELLARYRIPLDKLLLVAVAHELAHALCQETDETRAEEYATQLSSTGKAMCRAGRPFKPLRSSALGIDVSSAWTSARLSFSPTHLQFHERNLATRVSAREVWRL